VETAGRKCLAPELEKRMFSSKVPAEGTSMHKSILKSVCFLAATFVAFAAASFSQEKKKPKS
jgi:hypothetical protein